MKCSIPLKNLFLQKKKRKRTSGAPARVSAQGMAELILGYHEIIQGIEGIQKDLPEISSL